MAVGPGPRCSGTSAQPDGAFSPAASEFQLLPKPSGVDRSSMASTFWVRRGGRPNALLSSKAFGTSEARCHFTCAKSVPTLRSGRNHLIGSGQPYHRCSKAVISNRAGAIVRTVRSDQVQQKDHAREQLSAQLIAEDFPGRLRQVLRPIQAPQTQIVPRTIRVVRTRSRPLEGAAPATTEAANLLEGR